MNNTQKLINIAMFIALGIILPVAFHFVGAGGSVFLPMHIPVFMAGMLLGVKSGLAAGVLTPVLSSLLTGMPPLMPILPVIIVELGVYGALVGYLYRHCHLSLLGSLFGAMVVGRLAAAVIVAVLTMLVGVKMQPLTYLIGTVSTGLPGIVIQLIFIPLLVKKLEAVSVTFRQVKSRE
ncbi:MAG TPA: ECF transporter S component [Negativicutes bacterium]|jgi:riboflavin transporter FmnP